MGSDKNYVAQELGRVLSFWNELFEELKRQGSTLPSDDLFLAIHDADFREQLIKELRKLKLRRGRSFTSKSVLGRKKRSVEHGIEALRADHAIDPNLVAGQISHLLFSERSVNSDEFRFELWIVRVEMSIEEAHQILMSQGEVAPASPEDLVWFALSTKPEFWSTFGENVGSVYATGTLLTNAQLHTDKRNVVLSIHKKGSIFQSKKLKRSYVAHQTADSMLIKNSTILCRVQG